MIARVLIANRGEIAIRIARGARELGIAAVGVYSDADEHAAFRRVLDESIRIGPGPAAESYLDGAAIVAAAKTLGADAIHPGYGFLSERAPFASLVVDAGLIFIGPTPDAIAAMGSKIAAKQRVRSSGVPVVPGYDGEDQANDALRFHATELGTPLLIKASAGGGGRGMRVVDEPSAFDVLLAAARREAMASFGDDRVLLERYLRRPRHIEFQVLADTYGTTVHVGERECSIQRRHQKVIEEAPSLALDATLRARMGDAAIAAARAVGYTNAGTVEFMLDEDGSFYFLEMNARLQVEHPVTEFVYGIDLVHEQFHIAAGEPLRFAQSDVVARGWSIEARLNAEDPARDYMPQAGTIEEFEFPNAPGVRIDSGVVSGSDVPVYYDSLLAKIIVWGADRPTAVTRLALTLDATRVTGIATNLPLLRAIAGDEAFRNGDTTTRFLEERAAHLAPNDRTDTAALIAAAAILKSGRNWRLSGVGVPIALERDGRAWTAYGDRLRSGWQLRGDLSTKLEITGVGRQITIRAGAGDAVRANIVLRPDFVIVSLDDREYTFRLPVPPRSDAGERVTAARSGTVTSPMPGKIIGVDVSVGTVVEARALLVTLEAMKMEHRIEAPTAGTVRAIFVGAGDIVPAGIILVEIDA